VADDEMQTPDNEDVTPDVTPDAADPTPPEAADDGQPLDGQPEDAPSEDGAPPSRLAEMADATRPQVSQEDIDQLFADQDEVEAAPAMPAGGGAINVDDGALALLGEHADAIAPLARRGAETLSLGIESATGLAVTVASVQVTATDYAEIEKEFAAIPHLGFELRLSLSETESHVAGALLSLPDAGALFSLETAPEQMENEAFAAGQLEAAASTLRELLDLVSLTLFTEELSAAEVILSDQRIDQIDSTMTVVSDVSAASPPLRIDVVLALANGIPVTLTLVVPSSVAARLSETIRNAPVSEVEFAEPTLISSARSAAAVGAPAAEVFGDAATSGASAAPQFERPAATIGGSPDVEVHPVRFPPLPESAAPATAQRGLDLIMDVQMRVAVELGRSTMTVEDVLSLGPGSVVELNKLAGEPVDILVNDRLIARGEVVVVDENFGVRVTEIISPRRRARVMGA